MNHVLLWAEDSEAGLAAELASALPAARWTRDPAGLFLARLGVAEEDRLPPLAFLRQMLPSAVAVRARSIREWAVLVTDAAKIGLPQDMPWQLHIEPHYGETSAQRIGARAWHTRKKFSGAPTLPATSTKRQEVDPSAGRRRCEFIRETTLELLGRTRRHLLKTLRAAPRTFTLEDSLVQLVLTSPETGFLSLAAQPVPFLYRQLISPFPLGRVEVPRDPAAPSRAFAKLVEAEARLGLAINPGDRCVDLGAAPGSWTYVAVSRRALVTAVDRSALRTDLMEHRNVRFVTHDAFTYRPADQVDWLLCDVIAEPARSAALLLDWLRLKLCRRFVVTLKFKGSPALNVLANLRESMPALSSNWQMKKLCANKNEVCVYGAVR